MLGEDSSDTKMAKSKRSFSAQPMRARVLVIVAGVAMNFLLAWLLLWAGFSIGMQPLLGPDDVLPAVNEGQIVLDQGVKVKAVEEGSLAAQAGFKAEDLIYSISGDKINDANLASVAKDPAKIFGIIREGKAAILKIPAVDVAKDVSFKLGLNFYDYGNFPRVRIFEVKPNMVAFHAGLRSEDVILSVNGEQVFDITQYETLIRGVPKLVYTVFRDGLVQTVTVDRNQARQVIISGIIPDSPAEKAGLKDEDIILTIGGKAMTDSQEVVSYVKDHQAEDLSYVIKRGGQQFFHQIQPQEGRVGIFLSAMISYVDDQAMSLYNTD